MKYFLLLVGGYFSIRLLERLMMMSSTRGFRNNNPGNIRKTDTRWLGESDALVLADDDEFETFLSMEYGIRAIGKLLDTYYNVYGLHTIERIISRYAPPNENDTVSYIRSVSVRAGIGATDQLIFPKDKLLVVEAIIHHENGLQPFTLAFIDDALEVTA